MKHIITFSLLIVSFGLIASPLAPNAFAEDVAALKASAIAAIQRADAAGADTTELVDRFSFALAQVESPTANSCFSPEGCAKLTAEQFQSITDEANTLREEATRESYLELAMSQIITIAAAFAVAFGAVFLYHYRHLIRVKRYLRLAMPTRDGKH